MALLNKRDFLLNRPFIIYNQKTNDSFIILNINDNKKYILYFDWFNNERTNRLEIDSKVILSDNFYIY